ncbi:MULTISPECIES: hypothetical protein [Streptomyces]|uniref:hypothetical protein n=1 Tax=Streptomyces TaxID=1883 RepID=UPI000A5FA0B4|nr:hypothetical protein [Streptomyces durhamensis]
MHEELHARHPPQHTGGDLDPDEPGRHRRPPPACSARARPTGPRRGRGRISGLCAVTVCTGPVAAAWAVSTWPCRGLIISCAVYALLMRRVRAAG